jgi:putative molybdopterin biosynthesis protein
MDQHQETLTVPSAIGTLYTTMEVARMLRVSQRTVENWIRRGALTAVRYGRQIRVRQADIEAFSEELTGTAPAAVTP